MNLLVVDWDFFFNSPAEERSLARADTKLYQWVHRETPHYINEVWTKRAAAFLKAGYQLPQVNEQWRTFWDNFVFHPDSVMYYADANFHACKLRPRGFMHYNQVWLYDAHHDCGYEVRSYKQWLRAFLDSSLCNSEDWMLVHQMLGSKLFYRFPYWHSLFMLGGVRVPKGVQVDCASANFDVPDHLIKGLSLGVMQSLMQDTRPQVEFDHVFLCRSGAWVPSWCDRAFSDFLELCPISPKIAMQKFTIVRNFDINAAKELNR